MAGQGRRSKIPDAQAKKLATIYKRGFTTGGEQRGFRSIAHAKKKSKAFAAIVEKCGNPTDETILNSIKRVDANYKKFKQAVRKTLADVNKNQRRRAADTNTRKGIQRLRAVTFLDEFSITAGLPNTKVAGDKRKGDFVVHDGFQAKKHKNRPTINAIIAVNYAEGPLYIEWLTGTTGGVAKTYKVSSQPGCLLPIGQLCEYLIKRHSGRCKQISTACSKWCSKSDMSL